MLIPTSGTATFAASVTVTCSNMDLWNKIQVGMFIYNSTNNADTFAKKVLSKTYVTDTTSTVTLESAYAGTTGAGKVVSYRIATPTFQFTTAQHNRYIDPYHQRITTPGTLIRQKYLSQVSNNFLKANGDNLVLKGLTVTPTFLGSVITLAFTAGIFIHDSTLIEFTTTNTLTYDVAALADTPVGGAHLAVFTDFLYVEAAAAVAGGTATFAATTSVVCSNITLYNAIPVGSFIYNSTNDAATYSLEVISKSDGGGGGPYTLTLKSAYAGTIGAGKTVTADLNSQTSAAMTVYHVNSTGATVTGTPTFSPTRNKVMVCAIDFTKSGANVTTASERAMGPLIDNPSYLTLLGVNYYAKGVTSANINAWGILSAMYGSFLNEFEFFDYSF